MEAKLIRLLFQLFTVTLAGIGAVILAPNYRAQAATTYEELADTYFNESSIALYLGESGKESFDFDIKPSMVENDAEYSWYIKEGKGNPETVTIDSKTGSVTAKSLGTAYIRCKITMPDNTVLRPEAKVIVRNNITGIEITNIPADNTIATGLTVNFDTIILDTAAGKDTAASGIVRFELKDDTAGVGEVTDDGILTPSSSGAFKIRAVCFDSTDNYLTWLENKEDNAGYVTAASNWVTVNVLSTEATASTQKELNELLSNDIITKITISAKDLYVNIPKNDYSEKALIVDAPNTTIDNYAVFKQITVKSASGAKWNEYASGNSFTLYDCNIYFNIDKLAQVESIKLDTSTMYPVNPNSYNNKVVMNINGTLNNLDVMTSSDITISGTEKFVVVTIVGNQTKISSSCPLILELYADVYASLLTGAEQSFIFLYGDVTDTIENFTTDTLHINNNGDTIDLNSCQSITKDGGAISYNTIDTSIISKQTPISPYIVYATAIASGKTLSESTLHGTFYCNSMIVNGTLTWCEPETVIESAGYYSWIFTPADTIHYNTVTGKSYVPIFKQ